MGIYLLRLACGVLGLSENTAAPSAGMWRISSISFPEKYEREAEIKSGSTELLSLKKQNTSTILKFSRNVFHISAVPVLLI